MSSRAECMKSDNFLHQFRQQFIDKFQNPRLRQNYPQPYNMAEIQTQHLKEQQKTEQEIHELEASLSAKQKNVHPAATSGGDADRMLHSSPQHVVDSNRKRNINDGVVDRMMHNYTYAAHHAGDSNRPRNSDNLSTKHLHANSKPFPPNFTSNASTSSRKYLAADNYNGDNPYLFENDSNVDGPGNVSEDSAKSQKSSKTVVSRKSSHDLRKLVTSQCKLHEVIGETIKEMCNTEVENAVENNVGPLHGEMSPKHPPAISPCKRCADRLHTVQSQKDITAETDKNDSLDCRHTNTLTISVDDVINSRVINPMIHKLHRMYLNNLKEEMSLMEDLERLPNKVNEVYKSIIFKQKD